MTEDTKVVLVIEYDGTCYYGFQWQADLPTIQGEIEDALFKLTGERKRVIAASRTDTGVHASGQVVSFRTKSHHSPQTFVKGLNYHLPGDIAVKSAYIIDDSFNVRRHAISREYDYHILNSMTPSPLKKGFSHLVGGHLNIKAMNQACQMLIGEHDFASFVTGMGDVEKITVRYVHKAEVGKDGELTIFNMVADSFLRHQVRNTVGSLISIGKGRLTTDEFQRIIEARKLGLAGPAAPACGLHLKRVNYPSPLEEGIS